jgi:hypothetical protein
MPLTHRIDSHEQLVIVTISGTMSLEDVLSWRDLIFGESSAVSRYGQLIDATRALRVDVPLQQLARFTAKSFFAPGTARAFVATLGLSTDVATLLSTISEARDFQAQIFPDDMRARAWLRQQRDRAESHVPNNRAHRRSESHP